MDVQAITKHSATLDSIVHMAIDRLFIGSLGLLLLVALLTLLVKTTVITLWHEAHADH
jgi:hypothetical protein